METKQFQFQTGSIKSSHIRTVADCEKQFQFQTGSIKSLDEPEQITQEIMFQFQTGAIKSNTPTTCYFSKLGFAARSDVKV